FDTPVSNSVEGVSLKATLTLLLRDLRLTYVIRHGTLEITSDQQVNGKLKQVVYPVADLVVPIPSLKNLNIEPLPGRASQENTALVPWQAASKTKPVNGAKTHEDLLIELVTNSVAPETWDGKGGKATIQYFPLGMSLVVNQTADIQEEVAALL